MKDTVSHYVPPHSPLTSTEPQVFSNNLTMPSVELPQPVQNCVPDQQNDARAVPPPDGSTVDIGADTERRRSYAWEQDSQRSPNDRSIEGRTEFVDNRVANPGLRRRPSGHGAASVIELDD
jgi:hypothetical protein